MEWECSECGEHVEQRRHPIRCPSCGLAGVVFTRVPADVVEEDGGALGYWFERGASMSDYVGPASFLNSERSSRAHA
jgi:DNA-directed RNA polymerase subunit RPC12/RpoP